MNVLVEHSFIHSAYLAVDHQLVSDEGRRQLRSATSRTWGERTASATTETCVFQLQVRSCGTAFQLNCGKLTLAFKVLKVLKAFCSGVLRSRRNVTNC